MRLRNKKTGKIIELKVHNIAGKCYENLADVNKEWEDAPEEPKGYWFVDSLGEVHEHTKDSQALDIEQTAVEDWHLNIGNYFKTKEEAEKAVEKLKAWKRLKDDDFKFENWYYDVEPIRDNGRLNIEIRATLDENDNASLSDLNLLFGGEE